jgi:hypothetical protein
MDFAAAIVVASVAAILFFPALRFSGIARALAWLVSSMIVAASPCLIPQNSPVQRLIAAMVAIGLLVKLYDLFRSSDGNCPVGLRFYLAWLPNFFWLVACKVPPSYPRNRDLKRLLRMSLLTTSSIATFVLVFRWDWDVYPVALEHGVKVVATYWVVVSVVGLGAVAYRLLGGLALDPMKTPVAAATPAEFWRRWNRPAQQFLQEHVFRPVGGFRRPMVATFATFVVSAAVHEYLFDIAVGRLQGWQTAFFLMQGAVTALTLRLRPIGWQRALGTLLTLSFNLATAVLFFQSVNAVFDFYAQRPA